MVEWLIKNTNISEKESIEIGQKLLDENIIEYVTYEEQQGTLKINEPFHNNKDFFYKWV